MTYCPIFWFISLYLCHVHFHVYYFDNKKRFPLFGFYYVTSNGWIIDYFPFTNVILL